MIENKQRHIVSRILTSRVLIAILLISICSFSLMGASAVYTVAVSADGKTNTVKTVARSSNEILKEEKIAVADDDKVDVSGFCVGQNADQGNRITVYRAADVTVAEEGKEDKKLHTAGTVKDALEKSSVELGKEDAVDKELDKPLENGMVITVKRAFPVKVTADGKTKTVNIADGTVKDAVAKSGFELGKNDEVTPALDEEVKKGTEIKIHRVSYKEHTEKEVVEYNTVTEETSSMKKGETKVKQAGVNGSREVTYRDKIVDGEVAGKEVVSEKILKASKDKIVLEGTSIPLPARASSASKGGALKVITGLATAYTANPGALTATGLPAARGRIAVNPRQIPYGSKLYIESSDGSYVYGEAIAADTGGFASGGRITADLYFDSMSECRQWGVRSVNIYVLRWGY